MIARWWNAVRHSGLRARLVLIFALLGVVTAVAVSGGMYIQARTAILQTAQDTSANQLINSITAVVSIPNLPPTQSDLDTIANRLSNRNNDVLVVYRGRTSRQNTLTLGEIPPELQDRIGGGSVVWQRVSRFHQTYLLVGTRVGVRMANGRVVLSELEVYSARSLSAEQANVDALAVQAALTGLLSLVFAVLLALLAARGVLRPVRQLGQAARRLGEGDLSTRVPVRGSDELASVARTFNSTAEVLERYVGDLRRMEADARRFVADVSHELRTPLAAMTAVTDVLDEEAPHMPGDAAQAANLVSQETHKLTRLVNDLMEISRFDSGAAALALNEVDMAEIVRASLRARGWSDKVQTDLQTGVIASVDPRRMDVIIANLVGNALKYGEPPVTVRLHADGIWITVEVSDHGDGLAPEVLPRVFDRFYKADSARPRSEGSGLGLAIAWENARLHRGVLAAGNGPDGGAVFTLRLPVEPR
ncbi:sensor histidine kinase [Fodinicola acaciae]|uniref:sensor histidine kinase n=1 Tax=Fodinicola acaciae TaxID=2681555 RepID=UPI001FEBCC7C|nr:HAMP domain-containing sensor histidine kinase [Fodinicola acaciae]